MFCFISFRETFRLQRTISIKTDGTRHHLPPSCPALVVNICTSVIKRINRLARIFNKLQISVLKSARFVTSVMILRLDCNYCLIFWQQIYQEAMLIQTQNKNYHPYQVRRLWLCFQFRLKNSNSQSDKEEE